MIPIDWLTLKVGPLRDSSDKEATVRCWLLVDGRGTVDPRRRGHRNPEQSRVMFFYPTVVGINKGAVAAVEGFCFPGHRSVATAHAVRSESALRRIASHEW